MTLKTRKILYLTFVLIFLISAPTISLYAAGYTFGSGFTITKTGILIVDTKPTGATITLDNTARQKFLNRLVFNEERFIASPAKIKNIPPGEYEIKLSKDGYWDWQKKLSIKPGESTYIEDVSLFKKDIPVNVLSGGYESISLSLDKEYITAVSGDVVALFNLASETGEYFILGNSNNEEGEEKDKTINWSPDSRKLINQGFIFETKNWSEPFDIKKEIGADIGKIKWGNGSSIFYLSATGLNKFSLSSKINEKISSNPGIADFLATENFIYTLENELAASVINIYNSKTNALSAKINLPLSVYSFFDFRGSYLNVYDDIHKILYIIDPFSSFRQLRETISNASQFEWISDKKLLYANRHEIWIFDLDSRKNTLLTRISQNIQKVIWHPNNNYVIYGTGENIFAIELDDREKFNITRILSLDQINNPVLNKKGDTLYFYSQIGNQSGIYKLLIR